MKFELPSLPYAADALAPIISSKTLEFHHGKHHLAYVNNLNTLKEKTPFENSSLEEIICKAEGPLFNNAAQVWNHTFYFEALSSASIGMPERTLAEAIIKWWGGFQQFKDEFNAAAVSLFGSGWVWLVKDDAGKLSIVKESNAGNPMTRGLTPILTIDVWEHAYYLDYQNRRADYVNAFWNLIDWSVIEKRYLAAK